MDPNVDEMLQLKRRRKNSFDHYEEPTVNRHVARIFFGGCPDLLTAWRGKGVEELGLRCTLIVGIISFIFLCNVLHFVHVTQ